MKIETHIESLDFFDNDLITSNNCDTYIHVEAQVIATFKTNDIKHDIVLQTGLTHIMNDYSLPSNQINLYDGDMLFFEIENNSKSDFLELIEYLNNSLKSNYSKQDYLDIYHAYYDFLSECQEYVREQVSILEDEYKNDNFFYIFVTGPLIEKYYDLYDSSYTLRFDTKEEAQLEIDKLDSENEHAYFVNKEIGITSKHKYLSNF